MIAVPVGSEVKFYDRISWKCVFSLVDEHHAEVSCWYTPSLYYSGLCKTASTCIDRYTLYLLVCSSLVSSSQVGDDTVSQTSQIHSLTLQAVNAVIWSPCGQYLASGGADGAVCLWDVHSRKVYSRMKNEDRVGITALEWNPRGRDEAEQQVPTYLQWVRNLQCY